MFADENTPTGFQIISRAKLFAMIFGQLVLIPVLWLAVYGTASLYQKCPDKQAEGAPAPAASPAAATPPPVIQPAKKK